MSNEQTSIKFKRDRKSTWLTLCASMFLIVFHVAWAQASDLQIQALNFTQLSGGKLQLQLEMNGPAVEPKVFHTDNPARIALDFAGVKNALDKKKYPVNLEAADSVYVAESGDRVRVVINLVTSVPYETKVEGNKFLVTLMGASEINPSAQTETARMPEKTRTARTKIVSRLIPEQAIKGVDFRRGPNGEGRILVSLTEPNTMVNTREVGGKVELTFVNTKLP
ncbi:MAG: AMIN domain-containing protein, partial [Gammaproteobacteria bacterium]